MRVVRSAGVRSAMERRWRGAKGEVGEEGEEEGVEYGRRWGRLWSFESSRRHRMGARVGGIVEVNAQYLRGEEGLLYLKCEALTALLLASGERPRVVRIVN